MKEIRTIVSKVVLITISLFTFLPMTGCEFIEQMLNNVTTTAKDIVFNLNGEATMRITKNSTFVDPGYVAVVNGYTSEVHVTGTVDTATEGTYVIKYELEGEDKILFRNVIVSGECDELAIHFLELGNNYTGDSVYIKAGDTDILIDAGSRQNSSDAISTYINQFVTDGKLEYVIATHAHQDHIAGFTSTNSRQGIFERYDIGTLIDFGPQTNAETAVYEKYRTTRDSRIASGNIQNHCNGSQSINEEGTCKATYDIGDNIELEVLNSYFYTNETGDENDYSICIMINQGINHYLFTGDLEAEGEEKLVELNDLPEVNLFKGGHHGSYTASTDTLLSVIKPDIVCVCCCAGSVEYTQNFDNTFPAQAFINRVAKYTDAIYVTTLGQVIYDETREKYKDAGFTSMNGNIVVTSSGGAVLVTGSNNNTKLKDTEWFTNNREWPST